jgi:hypothetical protein
MSSLEEYLQSVWDGILSEDEEIIQETYIALSAEDQQVVLAHLQKMVSESGWHPVQVQSASKALVVLGGTDPA